MFEYDITGKIYPVIKTDFTQIYVKAILLQLFYLCGMNFKAFSPKADHIGMTASTLCAIHCAVVPVLMTALPLTGLSFLSNPWLEWGMICLALLIGIYAIGTAYYMHHHSLKPLVLFVMGFMMIIAGHILTKGWVEIIVVPAGGFLIAFAHFLNNKYIGHCKGKHAAAYINIM